MGWRVVSIYDDGDWVWETSVYEDPGVAEAAAEHVRAFREQEEECPRVELVEVEHAERR